MDRQDAKDARGLEGPPVSADAVASSVLQVLRGGATRVLGRAAVPLYLSSPGVPGVLAVPIPAGAM
jgi:hypothetical protein